MLAVELLLRRVWLPGTSDINQLSKIFSARGRPEVLWPAASELPSYVPFRPMPAPPPLSEQFPDVSDGVEGWGGASPLLLLLLLLLLVLSHFDSIAAAAATASAPLPPLLLLPLLLLLLPHLLLHLPLL